MSKISALFPDKEKTFYCTDFSLQIKLSRDNNATGFLEYFMPPDICLRYEFFGFYECDTKTIKLSFFLGQMPGDDLHYETLTGFSGVILKQGEKGECMVLKSLQAKSLLGLSPVFTDQQTILLQTDPATSRYQLDRLQRLTSL